MTLDNTVAAKQAAVRAASAAKRAASDAERSGRWEYAVRANQYALQAIHAAENDDRGKAEAAARLDEDETARGIAEMIIEGVE